MNDARDAGGKIERERERAIEKAEEGRRKRRRNQLLGFENKIKGGQGEARER